MTGDTFDGKTIALTCDMNLGGASRTNWTPIGGQIAVANANINSAGNYFQGTFDDMEHKIIDLYIYESTSENLAAGFFSATNGTIRNVGFENASIINYGYSNVGSGVVAYVLMPGGKIENSYVKNSTVTVTTKDTQNRRTGYIGGFTAIQADGTIIENCYADTLALNADHEMLLGYAGGIIGTYWRAESDGTLTETYSANPTDRAEVSEISNTYYVNITASAYCTGSAGIGRIYNYSRAANLYCDGAETHTKVTNISGVEEAFQTDRET